MSAVLVRRDSVLLPRRIDVSDFVCLLCSSKFVLLSSRTDSTLRRRLGENSSSGEHSSSGLRWRFRRVGDGGLLGFLNAIEGC